jgi:hypothetical protein
MNRAKLVFKPMKEKERERQSFQEMPRSFTPRGFHLIDLIGQDAPFAVGTSPHGEQLTRLVRLQ